MWLKRGILKLLQLLYPVIDKLSAVATSAALYLDVSPGHAHCSVGVWSTSCGAPLNLHKTCDVSMMDNAALTRQRRMILYHPCKTRLELRDNLHMLETDDWNA